MNDSPQTPQTTVEKDWLALSSLTEVFGPFTHEELKSYVAAGQIQPDARFFQRQPSLDGCEVRLASLAHRATDAEDRLRAADANVARLTADVKAKDLEFEGERQQLSADLSKVRAELLRRDAELETLRRHEARLAELEKANVELEARVQEAEQQASATVAASEREARRQKERADRLDAALQALRAAFQDRARRIGALTETLRSLAAETPPEEPPADAPAASAAPALRPVSPRRAVEDAEIIVGPPASQPVKDSASKSTVQGGAQLASIEAQAQQELARLRERGGGSLPRWGRKRA